MKQTGQCADIWEEILLQNHYKKMDIKYAQKKYDQIY